MAKRIAFLLFLLTPALAAQGAPDLLAAARKGDTQRVAALLAKGGPIESTDKAGRTPLMLAAQHGHADTVRLLLQHGAKPDARDRQGWTAYGLAAISTASGRDAVLKALPPQPPVRVALEVSWSPENLYNSCFLMPQQLTQQVAEVEPDARVAAALRDYALLNGKGVLEFVSGDGDATLRLKVRPGVSCNPQQSADSLTLAIDATLTSAKDQAPMLEKTFGGGLKGLHARTVTSPAQYSALYEDWAKSHAGPIYAAVLEAWLRHR
jgi:Ankyrin repeats (3 copies)